jgi:hypothetical protein
MTTPDFNDLRERVIRGEEVSLDEYKELITAKRASRVLALTEPPKATKTKSTAKLTGEAATQALNDLLGSLKKATS